MNKIQGQFLTVTLLDTASTFNRHSIGLFLINMNTHIMDN